MTKDAQSQAFAGALAYRPKSSKPGTFLSSSTTLRVANNAAKGQTAFGELSRQAGRGSQQQAPTVTSSRAAPENPHLNADEIVSKVLKPTSGSTKGLSPTRRQSGTKRGADPIDLLTNKISKLTPIDIKVTTVLKVHLVDCFTNLHLVEPLTVQVPDVFSIVLLKNDIQDRHPEQLQDVLRKRGEIMYWRFQVACSDPSHPEHKDGRLTINCLGDLATSEGKFMEFMAQCRKEGRKATGALRKEMREKEKIEAQSGRARTLSGTVEIGGDVWMFFA